MTRRRFLLLLLLLFTGLMLAMPALLRAVPSRYMARLPEPLNQLGAPRDQVAILPTVAMPEEARSLLQPTADFVQVAEQIDTLSMSMPPATPTAEAVDDVEATPMIGEASVTAIRTSSPTPEATFEPTPIPLPPAIRLEGFDHTFQSWNNCGPATLAMALSYFDLDLTQRQTAAVLKPDPEDRNVSPHELVQYVKNETDLEATYRVNGDLDTVRRLVSNGIPVILEIGIDPPGEYRWLGWYGHYLLIVAYDDEIGQFWVFDSWFGTSEEPLSNAHDQGRELPYSSVNEYWPHFNRTYIAIYEVDQAEFVSQVIGEDSDDEEMWENALSDVRAETAQSPGNAFLWFNLGTTYNALGQFEEASTAFDQARSLGLPWRMLWYQFGPYEAYLEVGRYEDVLLLTGVTLKDRPYFEESFYYRGLAQMALGEAEEARASLEQAVAFNPRFEPAALALGEFDG